MCTFYLRYRLSERKRATTIAVAIVGRTITILEAIQKRSHEPIYKTYKKIEAKGLRATTVGTAITKGGVIEKRVILGLCKVLQKVEN